MNHIKALWCRFQQCLGTFTILLVEASSEMGLFRHLSDYVSESVTTKIENLWGLSFFRTCLKFNLHFKNVPKNWENVFCFWDNRIWIGIVKFSLWWTISFSWAGNVLKSRPYILHVNKGDFFTLNWLGSDQWIWWRWCDAGLNSAWARLPCCLSKSPLKRHFLDICLTTFLESVISETQKLWGSSCFWKCSKFNLDFINEGKNFEKFFCFWNNCT